MTINGLSQVSPRLSFEAVETTCFVSTTKKHFGSQKQFIALFLLRDRGRPRSTLPLASSSTGILPLSNSLAAHLGIFRLSSSKQTTHFPHPPHLHSSVRDPWRRVFLCAQSLHIPVREEGVAGVPMHREGNGVAGLPGKEMNQPGTGAGNFRCWRSDDRLPKANKHILPHPASLGIITKVTISCPDHLSQSCFTRTISVACCQ